MLIFVSSRYISFQQITVIYFINKRVQLGLKLNTLSSFFFFFYRQPGHPRGVGRVGGQVSGCRVVHGLWDGLCYQLHEHSCSHWEGGGGRVFVSSFVFCFFLFPAESGVTPSFDPVQLLWPSSSNKFHCYWKTCRIVCVNGSVACSKRKAGSFRSKLWKHSECKGLTTDVRAALTGFIVRSASQQNYFLTENKWRTIKSRREEQDAHKLKSQGVHKFPALTSLSLLVYIHTSPPLRLKSALYNMLVCSLATGSYVN